MIRAITRRVGLKAWAKSTHAEGKESGKAKREGNNELNIDILAARAGSIVAFTVFGFVIFPGIHDRQSLDDGKVGRGVDRD